MSIMQKNNRLVWAKTMRFSQDMMASWTAGQSFKVSDVCKTVALPVRSQNILKVEILLTANLISLPSV
jgi:hypothetical protein